MAAVWMAGPLTGTLVQPYIGICSDNCRSRWGKRKPFMVLGGIATVVCLLALAWVQEIIRAIFDILSLESTSGGAKTASIVAAAILMYCLDFAINTVQAGIRAFIVDNAPWHQQKSANAWASRVNGAGNILGYCLGFMDLPKTFPIFGDTQFKVLCVIASISLLSTLSISCACIKEENTSEKLPEAGNPAFGLFVRLLMTTIRQLSPQIWKIFAIQFASWFGWFSFLFYATTYIGQLYVNPYFAEHRGLSEDEINKVWEEATRVSTFALFVNAIIAFAASIVIPFLLSPSDKMVPPPEYTTEPFNSELPQRGMLSTCASSLSSFRQRIWVPRLTLRRIWLFSHFLFALCMISTFCISSPQRASVMTGIVGISWAVTIWVPFALLATEIAQHEAGRWDAHLRDESGEIVGNSCPGAYMTNDMSHEDEGKATGQAGAVLGLHNVFVSVPQFVSSVFGSIIFKALQKPRGEPWDNSVAWVMRLGGCAALVAGILTTTLREQSGRH
ncbi:uncharacterized protein ATNIH1004_002999 [Aspergillus tanneri]|uniref:Sucrose transporter n=1 Tax=Aspergillus tanneri TaxID=1220188 RepID=A0A5M9MTA7_9EURO|nr:uncharacterized protein ATNIH1004_002999 [Aspergillus tanneri]KAA8650315.1 hypothetical protein ATNIH1004_002999 [Aspergillus tanneri]